MARARGRSKAHTVKRRVDLRGTDDRGLFRLLIDGAEAGCVREVEGRGWVPLGGFVFGPNLGHLHYASKEEAAVALATRLLHLASIYADKHRGPYRPEET